MKRREFLQTGLASLSAIIVMPNVSAEAPIKSKRIDQEWHYTERLESGEQKRIIRKNYIKHFYENDLDINGSVVQKHLHSEMYGDVKSEDYDLIMQQYQERSI